MKEFGLIGYPLTHSFSKKFFSEKFEQEQLDCIYENFEIPQIELITDVLKNKQQLVGMNVTIPYKEQVIPFLDELDEAAKEIGAVNTIKLTKVDNQYHLKGFNTDTYGFMNSIKPFIKPHHTKALILGTGGASKAVAWALKELGLEFLYVSRSADKDNCITYNDIDTKIMSEYTVIVNSTPLGTFPKVDTCPDLPYENVTERHLFYDLVYNPAKTEFLRRAEAKGATVKNGLDMLHLQALKAWEIWND
ncbi:shikimate dehydrogenase [Puteibacter caeruleilacunae]|nr:shikimate dehydrogenase [Puteibacter caeruleilacunae]